MGTQNLPKDIDRELRGPIQVNQALDVTTRKGFWNFQPDRDLTTRQNFDPYNVWYERNGGVTDRAGSGLYRVQTDGATQDSEAIIETSDLGVYRPGTLANVSGGTWFDVAPTGDAFYEIGYEQDGDPERLGFQVDSDERVKFVFDSSRYTDGPFTVTNGMMQDGQVTAIEDGGSTVAEVYGLVEQDHGFQPEDWQVGRGYLYGITLGWYGPTSVMPWVGEVANAQGNFVQRAWPLAMIRPVDGPLIEKPNRPWSVRAHQGTSGTALQARIGGRQFSTSGDVLLNAEPTFDFASQQSVPTTGQGEGNWSVVGVIKRKSGYVGTALGMDALRVVPQSNNVAVLTRVVDPSFLSGVSYDEPVDVHADQTAIETDIRSDTPDRVTLAEATIDGTTKLEGIGWTGGLANASNQGTGETRISAGFDFPIIREFPTVILAAVRGNNAATVTTGVEVLEVG
ncbi:hypothetical protein M201_gp28 [Haloarcula californiae tailed virus 2]|uniref:Uncharacterized protein n=1 Tax=Haloarcula californiae tailed virus 2 TaxID=1273747 RepID=R4T7Q2_9CAUD|nr:hypothetical protein M201_gp28 [Haloarcula californiae tailed virus 2]AGM11799.1 hypothetical protein HCTV2_25 [Haloarcula californiae tailed virus 2]